MDKKVKTPESENPRCRLVIKEGDRKQRTKMDSTPQMSKARKRRVKWDTWSELMLRILNRPDDENAADNDLSNGRWFTDQGT